MNELRSVHNNQTSKLEGWNNLKPVHARKHQFGAKGIEEILLKNLFAFMIVAMKMRKAITVISITSWRTSS